MKDQMERKKRSTENRAGSAIDMTSMIDVTFQLIIFFLCLEFKTLDAKLPAYLPKSVGLDGPKGPPMDKLDIHIYCARKGLRENGQSRDTWQGHQVRWIIKGRPYYTKASLEKALGQLSRVAVDEAGNPLPVTVHAHKEVFYGDVTDTVDMAIFQGFLEVNFAGGHTD